MLYTPAAIQEIGIFKRPGLDYKEVPRPRNCPEIAQVKGICESALSDLYTADDDDYINKDGKKGGKGGTGNPKPNSGGPSQPKELSGAFTR